MNLINPRLTVQNAEGSQWLLTFEHAWNEDERIEFTVKVPKNPPVPIGQVVDQAVTKAVELLQLLKRQPE